MPELPEVETIVRQLRGVLIDNTLAGIEVYREKSFEGGFEKVIGKSVSAIERKGKIIFVRLSGDIGLMIHLKMTGQLIWRKNEKRIVGGHPTVDWVGNLPSSHTRVKISWLDNGELFFNDMRVFGWIKVTSLQQWQELGRKLPHDVVDDGFDKNYFEKIVKKSIRPIKVLLMDGSLIGGVGNIYANDALWLAEINPNRVARSLKKEEVEKLYKSLLYVINKGIETGGASASNYVNLDGLGGKYQEHFLSYKKEGEKCSRCGGVFMRSKIGGRGSFWCPGCQK